MRARMTRLLTPAGLLGFMALCHICPGFAVRWQAGVSRPVLMALNRLTARWPFPLLEIGAVGALLCATVGHRALVYLVILPCALLWYPAYPASPVQYVEKPDAAALEALCDEFGRALDDGAVYPTALEAALAAPEAAGMPGCRVKCARYPEWMRALGLSGLFSPWTGEALIDPDAPRALIPFTAVHELMHLNGIADEGAANIEAWRRCMAQGGAFAESARVYALGRAMDALKEESMPEASPWARLPGIGDRCASYDALLNWLIEHPDSR